MTNSFTVGVIGAGRIGKIHIENLLSKIADVNLKIVADININDKLRQWAEEKCVPKLTIDAYEILNDSKVMATPRCRYSAFSAF